MRQDAPLSLPQGWLPLLSKLKAFISYLLGMVGKPRKLAYFRLQLEDGTMQRLLTLDQKATITLTGVDKSDNPTAFTGVPTWTNSSPEVGSLVVAADGRSAVFTALALGTTQVSASMGSIHSKDPVDFQAEAGGLVAFVLTVGPNEAQ